MAATRIWHPPYAVDLLRVLAPMQRGRADPTVRLDDSGTWWRAATTVEGTVTLRLCRDDSGAVRATAWGDGAESALAGVPDLLGASDDDSDFVPVHQAVARGQRTARGDPDAVSVGDFHLPTIVGTALEGRPLDDDGMLAALAPYAGQRHRAVRYLGAAGVSRPRYAPRLPVRDYRSI